MTLGSKNYSPDKLVEIELFQATVIERDSRVTVLIERSDGRKLRAHLRNTGRLEGLIHPDSRVDCQPTGEGQTKARVISAYSKGEPVLLDTHIHMIAVERSILSGLIPWLNPQQLIKKEVSVSGRRFDYQIQVGSKKGFLEMKSAVEDKGGWGMYPDAPTTRGLEHVKLLSELGREGTPCYVVFVLTNPNSMRFKPNTAIQPEIRGELQSATLHGVKIRGVKITVDTSGHVQLDNSCVPIHLDA